MSNVSGTVLIVEDEAVLREAYELILQSAGYTTIAAKNGSEALQQLKELTPNVMLLDVYMPIMDGRDVLNALKRTDHPGMKIVVCSNMSDNALRKEMLDNGADMFVLKSGLGPAELIEMVQEVTSA